MKKTKFKSKIFTVFTLALLVGIALSFGALAASEADDATVKEPAVELIPIEADENGLDVVCQGAKTYYIGPMTKAIPILTNVNWGEATFIIDDSGIAPLSNADGINLRSVHVFVLPSPGGLPKIEGLAEWKEKVNAEGGLKADEFKKIDVDFGEPTLLRLFNDEHKNYIRFGVNAGSGAIQAETIVVDKDGNLDPNTPLMYDYDKVTRIDAYKINVEPLTIEGGTFITYPFLTNEPQKYTSYARGISCNRSNATFKNIKHRLDREGLYNYEQNTGDYGCSYGAFFSAGLCNNVLYENCSPSAHVTYKGFNGAGMGTYDIGAHGTINLTYRNCAQEEDNFFNRGPAGWRWGVMGSSGNKNVVFENCKLTRFDAHAGVHNVRIVNSEIRMIRTNGTGTFYMENCKMYNRLLIGLREDYGGSWKGDIIIKNVTMEAGGGSPLLMSNTWYNHYFGYPTYMPENVIIDNFQLTEGDTVSIFNAGLIEQLQKVCNDEIDGAPNVNKTVPPKKIIIRNNTQGLKFIKPEGEYFKDTEIVEE